MMMPDCFFIVPSQPNTLGRTSVVLPLKSFPDAFGSWSIGSNPLGRALSDGLIRLPMQNEGNKMLVIFVNGRIFVAAYESPASPHVHHNHFCGDFGLREGNRRHKSRSSTEQRIAGKNQAAA